MIIIYFIYIVSAEKDILFVKLDTTNLHTLTMQAEEYKEFDSPPLFLGVLYDEADEVAQTL